MSEIPLTVLQQMRGAAWRLKSEWEHADATAAAAERAAAQARLEADVVLHSAQEMATFLNENDAHCAEDWFLHLDLPHPAAPDEA